MRICFHLQCFWTISIVWWAYKYSKISFNRKIYQNINILKILFNKYSNLKCNERSTNCDFTFYNNENRKTKNSAHLIIYFVFFSLVFSYVHKFKEKKENEHFLRWFYYDFFVFVIVIVVLHMDVTFVLLHLFHALHIIVSVAKKNFYFCLLM